MSAEYCACCGTIIPEGRQVCPMCEAMISNIPIKRKPMTLNEYQAAAMRTAKKQDKRSELLEATLGIVGEGGELADMYKKVRFQGHADDIEHAIKEAGDCLWYIALMADALGVTLQTVAEVNIEKLKARYPEGFDESKSINRKEGDI